jgi:hypothetical protein
VSGPETFVSGDGCEGASGDRHAVNDSTANASMALNFIESSSPYDLSNLLYHCMT